VAELIAPLVLLFGLPALGALIGWQVSRNPTGVLRGLAAGLLLGGMFSALVVPVIFMILWCAAGAGIILMQVVRAHRPS
jgi:hypothetical protein